jgi:predicted Ser/Thr protein kinase
MSKIKDNFLDSTAFPHLYLPEDPFPYAFKDRGLKNTLRDFLKVLRENPAYVEPTHSAFYRLIAREGTNSMREEALKRATGLNIPSYNACKEFFGVEEALFDMVNGYAFQASEGGGTRKKAMTLTGSPGAGKSDMVNYFQYRIMRKREPIPFLAGSPMWSNPLNALYLVKLIAETKTDGVREDMYAELVRIIDSLDLTDTAALDFEVEAVKKIVAKYGFEKGAVLGSEQLAEICMESDKDFVAVVVLGLNLDKPTLDALVYPDPWVQDVVLGEFAGRAFVKKSLLKKAGLEEPKSARGKRKGDPKYGEYDSEWAVELADYPLDNMYMSKGQGLVDVSDVQPINFDLKVWRGDTDISALGLYDDRDPRGVSASGAFNRGKLIVLTEGLRNPPEAFRILLEGLEGQRLSLPEPLSNYHQQGVGWEGMIIIHSNDEQWNKFYANPDHRAHLDRMYWVSVKYPLEPEQSSLVSDKLYTSDVKREPLMRRYIGMFRVATHIDWASKGNLPFMAVLNAYDGKDNRPQGVGTELNLRTLREKAPWTEGLDGMSPREMNTILGEMAARAKREWRVGLRVSPGFTVAELRDFMIAKFRKDPKLDKKTKELWTSWLEGPLEREFRRVELSKVYKSAFIANYTDLCQKFFAKYIDYIKALNRNIPRTGYSGGRLENAQQIEQFLAEIERADALSINSAQSDKFRTNVMVAINEYNKEHGVSEPPYTCHEGLRRCIEAYVLRQAKDITGVVGVTNLSEDDKKKMADAKSRLIKEHGYDEYCAERLVVEVAMTRDFLVA